MTIDTQVLEFSGRGGLVPDVHLRDLREERLSAGDQKAEEHLGREGGSPGVADR